MNRTRSIVIATACFLLLASCSKQQPVRRDVSIGKELLQVMMPTGKEVVHPVHGKEVWFALGAMNGEGESKANGVAQSHVFADGSTIATVNLNIDPAPKGSNLVAWLRKPGSTERVRLDVLQNPLKDVRHVITKDIGKDLTGYTEVIVTLEKSVGPADADPVMATGLLKVQQR